MCWKASGIGLESNAIAGAVVCALRKPEAMTNREANSKTKVRFICPLYRTADDEVGCVFAGLRMIFCARQAEISDTKSWSGLRQSIS